MNNIILVDKLVKEFYVNQKEAGFLAGIKSIFKPKRKTVLALDSISFSVKEGELIGFIGPNGAGKTTTLKILSGLLYSTSGLVQVLGFDPWEKRQDFLKKISLVMGQKNQLWWDLPAIETLELNRAIYEIPHRDYKKNLGELVALLEVENLLNIPVRRLSLGQRMRLELVDSLIHQPQILFLDEPTIALDIFGQAKIRDFLVDYNRRNGATVLLTSHNMDDISGVAKRVIVININKGKIIFDGPFQSLINTFARKKVIKIYLNSSADVKRFEQYGKILKVNFPEVVVSVPREVVALAAAEILQNFPVADINIEEEPLEEIIKRVFRGKKVENA